MIEFCLVFESPGLVSGSLVETFWLVPTQKKKRKILLTWIIDGPSSSALFNSLQGYLTLTNNTYPYIMGLDLFELKSSDILDLILIKHVPTACLTIWCIQS